MADGAVRLPAGLRVAVKLPAEVSDHLGIWFPARAKGAICTFVLVADCDFGSAVVKWNCFAPCSWRLVVRWWQRVALEGAFLV
jgi:hypothetical protein